MYQDVVLYISPPPSPTSTSVNLSLFGCFFLLLYRPDLPFPAASTYDPQSVDLA